MMMGISVCRNTKLANVFYRLELIEAYGTGIRKIMNAYAETGKIPQIETSDNAFKIILPNLNVPTDKKLPQNEDKILSLIREHGTVTRKEAETALGISQATCVRLLKRMIQKQLITQEGKGKNTYYFFPR